MQNIQEFSIVQGVFFTGTGGGGCGVAGWWGIGSARKGEFGAGELEGTREFGVGDWEEIFSAGFVRVFFRGNLLNIFSRKSV